VVRSEGKWKPLRRWIEGKKLDQARNLWKKKVQKIFNVELEEIDIKSVAILKAGLGSVTF